MENALSGQIAQRKGEIEMKITTFNPMIMTANADGLVKLFEEIGFEKRHEKNDISGKDITEIRMNVDDFDEGYAFLTAHGFTNLLGQTLETESSRFAVMISSSGFVIDLMYHKKVHEAEKAAQ